MLKLILFAVLLIGLAIGGIAIKMFVKKDGEFRKSCSSVHPVTGERVGCSCGKAEGVACKNRHHHVETEFEEMKG